MKRNIKTITGRYTQQRKQLNEKYKNAIGDGYTKNEDYSKELRRINRNQNQTIYRHKKAKVEKAIEKPQSYFQIKSVIATNEPFYKALNYRGEKKESIVQLQRNELENAKRTGKQVVTIIKNQIDGTQKEYFSTYGFDVGIQDLYKSSSKHQQSKPKKGRSPGALIDAVISETQTTVFFTVNAYSADS